jgi:hypothetical protein
VSNLEAAAKVAAADAAKVSGVSSVVAAKVAAADDGVSTLELPGSSNGLSKSKSSWNDGGAAQYSKTRRIEERRCVR